MRITLYNNPQHYKFVDKRGYLQNANTIDCVLKTDSSIINPVVEISKEKLGDIAAYNYAYIPEFKRYYFLTDAVAGLGGIAVLSFKCDVLTSNANKILQLQCQVARQEYNFDMDLPDSDIPVLAKRNLTYRNFSATPFSTNPQGRHFVMTVSGSSAIGGND